MSLFAEYAAHGWLLCAIDAGKKAPTYAGWQTRAKAAEVSAAAAGLDGAGLLHAYSGTCALDIDNLAFARPWLAERGVDVDALLTAPNAVRIHSGRPGRAKLLYRLSKPLQTFKPEGSGVELRCATASGTSAQDVLPPSVHPDTKKPYEWRYGDELVGHWSNLPPIPPSLLALWRGLVPAVQPAPEAGTGPKTDELRALLKAQDPNCGYNQWVKVGMALHHACAGAAEGLALWDEWSRGAPDSYKGVSDLRTHWVSFNSAPGKRVVTAATLIAEAPATPDEFPEINPEDLAADEADSTAAKIEQAVEMRKADAINWLEKRLIYVSSAACYFDTEKHHLIYQDRAIEHEFTGYMPKVKGGRMSPVRTLKESRTKRVVEGVGFHPGEGPIFVSADTGDEYVNVYRNRLPAPLEPTEAELERIEWLFDRIDDAAYRGWLKCFFGHVVQRPGVKIKSAPLIWSETQGNGKTTLLRAIPALLVGRGYSREVTSSLLNSDFNDYLLNAWHVNLTEFRADSRGERRAISAKLKAWVTDDEIAIHPKGSTAYTMPSHFFVTATSNEEDAAAIDNNDRRWGVHELKAAQFTPTEQTWMYDEFLSTKRAAAVLRHYFLNIDISDFSPSNKAPETEARAQMIESSMSSEVAYLRRCFEERSGPFERDVVRASDVSDAIRRETRFAPSDRRVGRILTGREFKCIAKKGRVGKGTVNFLIVANHDYWSDKSGVELAAEASGENFNDPLVDTDS